MMDLTKTAPRSVKETMLGIVQLARTTDKAKAVVAGQVGEYHYDCPMDQALFDFLAMDPKEFLDAVKAAKDDSEIEAYAKPFVAKKDRQSLEAFHRADRRITDALQRVADENRPQPHGCDFVARPARFR
jgi:hypothetical protein